MNNINIKRFITIGLTIALVGLVGCGSKSEDVNVPTEETVEVSDDNQAVEFPDPNLEAVIRECIGKSSGPIYIKEVWNLKDLKGLAKGKGIKSLSVLNT